MAGAASSRFAWERLVTGREGPGRRSRHGLVYDSAARATVLFGGIDWSSFGRVQNDTWELHDGVWSRVGGWRRPPARHRGAMVYDPVRGHTVLFGGQGRFLQFLRDTWLCASGHWTKWRAGWFTPRPSSRCGHSMVFDEATGEVVLFGGIDRFDHALGDTWLFDGEAWRQVTGTAPRARRYAAFAYDPGLGGSVLHGGARDDAGKRMYGDAWLFADGRWESLGTDFDTDPRDDHGFAYHRTAGLLVMLEGVTGERGVLVRGEYGWEPVDVRPLHPRHQCSPLAWDESLGGLVLHGGEEYHGGPQSGVTRVLRLVG